MENRDFNIVTNWRLYCCEMKEVNGGVRLGCMLNGRKREDGTYPAGIPVSVMCLFKSCDIPEDADGYNSKYIDVSGGIIVSEYKSKEGKMTSGLTIFADKVRLHNWDKNSDDC